jgi:hypothetical protein
MIAVTGHPVASIGSYELMTYEGRHLMIDEQNMETAKT